MAVIAIDLGGTKLAGAILDQRGKLIFCRETLLRGRRGQEVGALVSAEAAELVARAGRTGRRVTGLGVCVPGISHIKKGTVWVPNIPGWQDYPLRAELETAVGLKGARISIDSDRACCILGEAWRGAARGCRNAIFLAVGTGIGAGILMDGRILRGAGDSAGAIGWLALERPFRCSYTECGCFEHYASGAGLVKLASSLRSRGSRNAPLPETAQDVFRAWDRRDDAARRTVARAIEYWGMGVANLVSLFNPERIIFGGGIFGPARRFLADICAEARKWAQPVAIHQVQIVPSKLGRNAALYGAGALALGIRRDRNP